jgi:hypothetical protein
MRPRDQVEADYERAIAIAAGRGDTDEAHELSIGLRQYRELYKIGSDHEDTGRAGHRARGAIGGSGER